MTSSIYPDTDNMADVVGNLKEISRLREIEDIPDFTNLVNVFVSGRKVPKIPSSSADVVKTDTINDMNWDASFLYILVDNAGTAVWRRVAIAAF